MQDDQNPINPQNTVSNNTTPMANSTVSDNATVQDSNTLPITNNVINPQNMETVQTENLTTTPSFTTNSDSNYQPNQENILTSSHTPKKYGGKKIIATIFGVLVLVGGITAGVTLVQRQQLLEQEAASGKECQQAEDCILLEEPGNSGSYSAPGEIVKIDITAKDVFTYQPGTTEDGCYRVNIEGRNVTWQRYGDGPNCKDVSNVQIKFRGSIEFIKICHYTQNPSAHPWQAIEISQQAWDMGHDDAHDFKKTEYDFLYTNSDTNCPWPEPGNQGITCADIWCENNTTPVVTPTPEDNPQITAECSEVKIYNSTWKPLTAEGIDELNEGNIVRFAVSGETSSGTFDKAKFSVNSTNLGETTLKKPGTEEFYIEYTIPGGIENFTVTAQIHHSELGWF